MGAILPGPTYRKWTRVQRNRTQTEGEIVEVSDERVRKAARELIKGNHVDQREYMLKC